MALNSVSEDVRTMLDAAAKGVAGTDLYSFQWGSSADGKEVDKQILVVDTQDVDAPIKDEIEQPTFVIFVRGNTNERVIDVYNRARDIYQFMITQIRQTLNGIEYVEFAPIGGLLPNGKDANNRFVYSMNFFTFRDSIGDSI